ncbi:MAG: hypothetical protein AVDCRST_MAG25-2045, partial [uncultured Rubrobacteraceae bacterium]
GSRGDGYGRGCGLVPNRGHGGAGSDGRQDLRWEKTGHPDRFGHELKHLRGGEVSGG